MSSEERRPAIPQEGVFVALPNGATNIKVSVLEKDMKVLSGKWKLNPAPRPVLEEEHLYGKGGYTQESSVYKSDKEYTGKDLDFLGQKSIEGIPVAHILLSLAQYKPLSESVSFVNSIIIEISYDVSPNKDIIPTVRSLNPIFGDMILDFENLNELVIDFDLKSDDKPISVLKKTTILSEYIIITTEVLSPSVQPLLAIKSGWPHYARVITTETISSEFPSSFLKDSIRAFLLWAWDNWRVPPRFVVLAGDVDMIPVHYYGQRASDHYYADVKDNLSPEIVVSRLPTSNAEKMEQICESLAEYSSYRGADWARWKNEVLLVSYQDDVYKDCSDDIATSIESRFRVKKLYGDSSSKQDVIDEMDEGALIVNYRAHGSKRRWSSSNGLKTSDIHRLNNGQMPPMVFNICCQNAWIDDQETETVVETFMRENKSVAILGASRNSYTYANNDFNEYLFQSIMNYGDVTTGAIVQRAKNLMVQNNETSRTHMDNLKMYILFGDPTAKVASTVDYLRRKWAMDHDGWKGTLDITRIWKSHVKKIGSCGYPVWKISGTYKGKDGRSRSMNGTVGGRDSYDNNSGCKRTDHMINFTVAFPGNNQHFKGHIMRQTRNTMAGTTWWLSRPFAWYTKKL